jgi:hypothetical protein
LAVTVDKAYDSETPAIRDEGALPVIRSGGIAAGKDDAKSEIISAASSTGDSLPPAAIDSSEISLPR